MRADMKKLLCESPRVHGGRIRKGRTARSYEDLPFREGMSMTSRKNGWSGKEFGEHLAPLKRYIEKQIGRPWDKVYSEICKSMGDGQTPVESHIFVHLDGYICINVVRCSLDESRTGLVYHGMKYRHRWAVSSGQLYVCPTTGIIKRAKSLVKDKPRKHETNYRKLDDNYVALKLNGIWYRYKVITVKQEKEWMWFQSIRPEDRGDTNRNYKTGVYSYYYMINGGCYLSIPMHMSFSHLLKKNAWETRHVFGRDIAVCDKAQLTSNELRKYNLKNDR